MPQSVRKRQQRIVNYSANNVVAEQLSRGMVYRELYLRLQGQPTCLAGNNTYAATLAGDEWATVRRIRIVANGTDVLVDLPGNALWWLNYFWYGRPPQVAPLVGASGANPTFDTVLILPFWMPQSIRPIDTALDSRILSDLFIEVTWGDHLSMNAGNTGWTTAPTLTVYSAEAFGIKGKFGQWRRYEIDEVITATTPNHQVLLPVGSLYRGFMFRATDAGADSGAIINNVRLVSGTTVYEDIQADVLHQVQRLRTNVYRGYSGTAYDDLRQGDANSVDGVYYLDHVMDGYLSESIETLGLSEFTLEFDVTVGGGATHLLIYPQQIVPVRGAQ